GMMAVAKAPMSSARAKTALENRAVLRLPKDVDRGDVQKMLRKLAKRHPMLGAQIRSGGVEDGLEFGVTPLAVAGDGTAPLDVQAGEMMRASVAKVRLVLQVHSAIADAASMDLLVSEMKALLDGKDLQKPAPGKAVKALPGVLAYDPETVQGRSDRAFFYYTLADGAAQVPFARRTRALLPLSLGQDHGPAATLSGPCAKQTEARHMQAFAQALREVTQSTGNVLMARAARIGETLPKGPCIGPFTLQQPLLVSADPDDPTAARKLDRALTHAAKHHSFDCFAAAEEFASWFDKWQVTPLQIGFEMCAASQLKQAVSGVSHDVLLQVAKTKYRLIYDADVVAQAQADALAKAYEAALQSSDKKEVSEA
ncbi:MAG: hypothetical protein AAF231_15140, partial [Pseudomonadota bacterium]